MEITEFGKRVRADRRERRRSAKHSRMMIKVRSLSGFDSVPVAGEINRKSCPMVIDSGANQTIIHRDFIEGQELPQAEEKLSDVTGRSSTLWGPVEVQLRIGDIESTHRVYVSEQVAEPCI